MTLDLIFEAVKKERAAQDSKWGVPDHAPDFWVTILTEEVGEVSRAVLHLEPNAYRNEIIQTMAVLAAMLEQEMAGRTDWDAVRERRRHKRSNAV